MVSFKRFEFEVLDSRQVVRPRMVRCVHSLLFSSKSLKIIILRINEYLTKLWQEATARIHLSNHEWWDRIFAVFLDQEAGTVYMYIKRNQN